MGRCRRTRWKPGRCPGISKEHRRLRKWLWRQLQVLQGDGCGRLDHLAELACQQSGRARDGGPFGWPENLARRECCTCARCRSGGAVVPRLPRSEERRVGKECVRPCRAWWSP